jgi:hypothetical protein
VSSDVLPVVIDNAEVDIALALPDFADESAELRHALEFCRHFRVKGIASFLLSGAAAPLYQELSKSGRAFLDFLGRGDDAAKATGRSMPFFDAVAALDVECARAIAARSRRTWNPERELEDDFLYVRFVMTRFFLDGAASEATATLTRWTDLVADEPAVKLDLCRALSAGIADDFHDALCRWLAQQAEEYAELAAVDGLVPAVAATEAHVSVEGLALLRLAEAIGMTVATEYPLIPSLARTRLSMAFDADAWRQT